ncbi:10244_t:CDS:2 [Entrophospora sp. SA101]|nr:10244_t:CDS:2 [Entrophospora sp. SA101]
MVVMMIIKKKEEEENEESVAMQVVIKKLENIDYNEEEEGREEKQNEESVVMQVVVEELENVDYDEESLVEWDVWIIIIPVADYAILATFESHIHHPGSRTCGLFRFLATNPGKYQKLQGLSLKFDNAYEGLCDFEVSKEEQQLPIDEIKNNLRNIEREPLKNIGKIKSSELSWRNPLASQVISSEEEMESVKYMQKSLPNSVKTTCEEFVLNYDDGTMETPPQKLSHVNWTEREEALKDISVKILGMILNLLMFTQILY